MCPAVHYSLDPLYICATLVLGSGRLGTSCKHWTAGALSLLVLIITSGYAIVRTSIPDWWTWAYWISPFAYGLRAVVINELTSPGWDAIQPGSTDTVGVYSLKSFGFFTER